MHFPDRMLELYPEEQALKRVGAVSYMGVPLTDLDGTILGHLAVIDRRAMPARPESIMIFQIFAGRAAAELRRLRAERELRAREAQLAGLVDSAMDAIVQLDGGLRVIGMNPAAERTFGLGAGLARPAELARLVQAEDAQRLELLARELVARPAHERSRWISGGVTGKTAEGTAFSGRGDPVAVRAGRPSPLHADRAQRERASRGRAAHPLAHRRDRVPARGAARAGARGRDHGPQRGADPGAARAGAGGADGHDRAGPGRDGDRQGAVRARHPRRQRTARQAPGEGELRGDPGDAHRERVLRPRAGRLHRGDRQAGRPLHAGRRRHHLPGRGRGTAHRPAGQAAARAAGGGVRAGGQLAHAQGRRAGGGRDQPGPVPLDRGGEVPRGPLLPAERLSHHPAAAARTGRRRRLARRRSSLASLRGGWDAGWSRFRPRWPRASRRMPGRETCASSRT